MPDGGKPSRESLREVKREYKARRKEEQQRAKNAAAYWDAQTGQARRRSGHGGRAAALVAGVTALGVVAASVVLHLGPFASTPVSSAAGASPSPSTVAPSAPVSTAPSSAAAAPSSSATSDDGTDPSLADKPFEGTPAAAWKSGTTGLVAPRAKQVGIFRTKQVAAAYAMTIAYLTQATTNPRVLFKGEMAPVLATLGPGFPSYAKSQHALWVKSQGAKGFGWVDLANRFHVGDWRAAAATRGRAKISAARIAHGHLQVPFVAVTAYWLAPAKGGDPRAIAVRRNGYLEFVGYGPNKVWLKSWLSGSTSTASVCGSPWPHQDFVQAWIVMPTSTAAPADQSVDITDPDAPEPTACFRDTSGF